MAPLPPVSGVAGRSVVLSCPLSSSSLVAEYQCRAETRLGRDSEAIQVTEGMVKEAKRREQELQFNTVRRNVVEAEAQPFTSSASSLLLSLLSLLSLLLHR